MIPPLTRGRSGRKGPKSPPFSATCMVKVVVQMEMGKDQLRTCLGPFQRSMIQLFLAGRTSNLYSVLAPGECDGRVRPGQSAEEPSTLALLELRGRGERHDGRGD